MDDYHGVKIADPYRSLENADAPATRKWIEQENELTFSWLAKVPNREAIRDPAHHSLELREVRRFFIKPASHYFYFHNSGLQNQSVLYVMDSLNGKPRELLDPNTYRKDGTAAINGESVAGTASCMATRWRRPVPTGTNGACATSPPAKTSRLVRWSKGTVNFLGHRTTPASTTARFPEPPPEKLLTVGALDQKVYYHKLGDPQSADKLVYARPDHPDWTFPRPGDGRRPLSDLFIDSRRARAKTCCHPGL